MTFAVGAAAPSRLRRNSGNVESRTHVERRSLDGFQPLDGRGHVRLNELEMPRMKHGLTRFAFRGKPESFRRICV